MAAGNGARLFLAVFDLGRRDIFFPVLFEDLAGHRAFFAVASADGFVVPLLVALVIEIIGNGFTILLDLDGGLALLGFLEGALGTKNGAFQRFFLGLIVCSQAGGQNEYGQQTTEQRKNALHGETSN